MEKDFNQRRKKEFMKMYAQAKKIDLSCHYFRDKTYREYLDRFKLKAFLFFGIMDIYRAKKNGYMSIRNEKTDEEHGALYLREYNDHSLAETTNNYVIELLFKSDKFYDVNYLIETINNMVGEYDFVAVPQIYSNATLIGWTTKNGYYDDLERRIKAEYGQQTTFKVRDNIQNLQFKTKKLH